MTTNLLLGIPFGIISVCLHWMLLFFDPRRSYRFYNISLLLWVSGNFIWMTVEFCDTQPSSHIRIGPHTPIGGMAPETVSTLINIKTILFLLSSLVQIVMYLLVYSRCILTPEDEEEDLISKNEAMLFFYGEKSFDQSNNSNGSGNSENSEGNARDALEDDDVTLQLQTTSSPYGLTLALIENAYIIFWVSKDLFWSWGTGDLTKGRDLAIMFESMAMCFGSLSIFIYVLTAYLYRRNIVRFLDSITTVLWISANFVWMCGEFFIRYDNLRYDDEDAGNDGNTRILSAILFLLGILLQLYILIALYLPPTRCTRWLYNIRKHGQVGGSRKTQIEMTNMSLPVKYSMITFSPLASSSSHGGSVISQGSSGHGYDDEEEETTVLF